MSKSTEESNDLFTECSKNVEKFFNEIGKSTPVYHQAATDIQENYLRAWKNVINSSIALQKEFALKSGMNIPSNEEAVKAIQTITEYAETAYQKQNKLTLDSIQTSQKMFDVFNENTKTFATLNKNMMDFLSSIMKSNVKI